MEEKLKKLYEECSKELKLININLEDVGKIDISFSKRNNKRYGFTKSQSLSGNPGLHGCASLENAVQAS